MTSALRAAPCGLVPWANLAAGAVAEFGQLAAHESEKWRKRVGFAGASVG